MVICRVILFCLNVSFFSTWLSAQDIMWDKTMGGTGFDVARSIQQTPDGGYIVAGYSQSNSSLTKSENSIGGYDYWVLKLDMEGNIEWDNTIGGTGDDYMHVIQLTTDGGYICGGYSRSNITGDKTEICRGNFDYWIVKLNSSGQVEWDKTIGGNELEMLLSIQQTTDGGFICGGFSHSGISGDKTEALNGFYDYWVVKLNPAGSIEWQKSIGGSSGNRLNSIQQTADGGYICGGWSSSGISGDKTEACIGYTDFWIVKLDPSGNIIWDKTVGGNHQDDLYYIEQTSDFGYICSGNTRSDASGHKSENNFGSDDWWIVKLDSVGNVEWENSIGGSLMDQLSMVKQMSDGGYICAGRSFSDAGFDKTESNHGQSDYWLVKLDKNGIVVWQNTIGGNKYDDLSCVIVNEDGDLILAGGSNSDISPDKSMNCLIGSDYWILKISSSYNLVQGIVFVDADSNSTFDIGESPVASIKIIETNSGKFTFTNPAGFYSLQLSDTGNYDITIAQPPNYFNALPSNHVVNFNGMMQIDSLNDFAFQAAGTFSDLCAIITPLTPFRPGMNANYRISFSNFGTIPVSPDIVFFPDSHVTYLTSNVAPFFISTDSVVFSTGVLHPYQSGSILITVNVSTSVAIGTLINSGVQILPIVGDHNPVCNTHFHEVFVTGSYDPNDILVDRNTLLETEFPNPPYLEYLIRFQNTGNDTAFYVRVDNRLPDELNPSTFELVTTSHPCSIEHQIYENTIKFTFNNILLPDSNVNEPLSHGFARYRIKPVETLVVGDSVMNSALIYFDYNFPVATNIALTDIVPLTTVQVANTPLLVSVSPNPAKDQIRINFYDKTTLPVEMEMFNIYGQKVKTVFNGLMSSDNLQLKVDISDLPQGMYLLVVTSEKKTAFRIVKL